MQPIIEQAVKRIPSEPYPELRAVLERFVAGVQNALKGNILGAYLVGSLAIGDFDLDSDIDFLIVTGEELSDADVPLLQALHLEIYNLGCHPARNLEGSFISRQSLARTDLVGLQPFWFVDNGSTLLERSVHDNQWHVRWVLRERGITLTGPDAKTLVEPVSPEALRTEMQGSIERLKTLFLAEIDKPLGWFNSRFGRSFAVLTCCRVLHTFQSGAVKSKLAAVQWAKQTLAAKWHELIRQAWTERKGVRFGVKVRQLADVTLLHETARFVAYSQSEFSQQR